MTQINWEIGTAYDFFISLSVLNKPTFYGLRPSWAAGVRSRVTDEQREFLDNALPYVHHPAAWIHQLPAPKDTSTALTELEKLDPVVLTRLLLLPPDISEKLRRMIERIMESRSWTEEDQQVLRNEYFKRTHTPTAANMASLQNALFNPSDFGERYLDAIQNYFGVFFQEEEKRIRPALQSGLDDARQIALKTTLPRLLETLSRGVRFHAVDRLDEITIVPSYWLTPLVSFIEPEPGKGLFVFGCRADTESLVPGDQIPPALITSLKALADPTRLRILRHLASMPLTSTELARLLRLRPPTVIHHLGALRLAGLVQITIQEEGERRYSLRSEALAPLFRDLENFLLLE